MYVFEYQYNHKKIRTSTSAYCCCRCVFFRLHLEVPSTNEYRRDLMPPCLTEPSPASDAFRTWSYGRSIYCEFPGYSCVFVCAHTMYSIHVWWSSIIRSSSIWRRTALSRFQYFATCSVWSKRCCESVQQTSLTSRVLAESWTSNYCSTVLHRSTSSPFATRASTGDWQVRLHVNTRKTCAYMYV